MDPGESLTDSKMSRKLQCHTPQCFKYVDCCLSNLCLWRIFCVLFLSFGIRNSPEIYTCIVLCIIGIENCFVSKQYFAVGNCVGTMFIAMFHTCRHRMRTSWWIKYDVWSPFSLEWFAQVNLFPVKSISMDGVDFSLHGRCMWLHKKRKYVDTMQSAFCQAPTQFIKTWQDLKQSIH